MRILVTGGAGFIGSHVVGRVPRGRARRLVVDSLWEHGGGRRENVPLKPPSFSSTSATARRAGFRDFARRS